MNNIVVADLIDKMSLDLETTLAEQLPDALIIGIQTGGLWVAEQLQQRLKLSQEVGRLNISFYRDDFTRIGLHPEVTPSSLPFDIEDKTIILVDDVLSTGRTIRAALNEIFDYGRPARVILAILVDRKQQELPIKADVCGIEIDLNPEQDIKLSQTGQTLTLKVSG